MKRKCCSVEYGEIAFWMFWLRGEFKCYGLAVEMGIIYYHNSLLLMSKYKVKHTIPLAHDTL